MAKAPALKPEAPFVPVNPGAFTSKFSGLRIMYKRGEKDPATGRQGPSEYIEFKDGKFETTDQAKIDFLMGRNFDGQQSYGTDYWLTEETIKYHSLFPEGIRTEKLAEAQADTIERLKAQLAALTAPKA